MHEYDEALSYHHKALALAPHKADTYACIGFVLCHKKEYDEAVDYLHKVPHIKLLKTFVFTFYFHIKSLSLRRDDVFVVTLLEYVIEEFVTSDTKKIIELGEVFDDSGPPPTLAALNSTNSSQKNADSCKLLPVT